MAFMEPAPDQAFSGLMRSGSIPSGYCSVMSPTDSMSSYLEPASASTTPYSRSPTTSPNNYQQPGSNWQALQDMQISTVAESGMYKQEVGRNVVGSAPSELLGSSMMCNDWQQLLDSNTRFSNSLPPVSMASNGSRGIMEGARIRELIGRSSGGQKVSSSSWSPMDASGITVDPSKGGLALQGVGLAASHCLAQFTSDPAFAERAAKFSSFGNGKYSQIAQPLPLNDVCKPRARFTETSGKLSRTSSCHTTAGVKKQCAAVAIELEDKGSPTVASAAAAAAAGGRMEVEALGDDKSLPSAATLQQKLEAVEGATEATMDAHEVEVPAQENSSCSEQQGGRGEDSPGTSPARSPSGSVDNAPLKRKISSDKDARSTDIKVVELEDSKPKRCKVEDDRIVREDTKVKGERSCSENSAESGSPRARKENHKPGKDLSKQDYIHVRARRGQATDSHSLAERVRREKISERMKYLQDLVPGCSKVTGKAVMLDEIINYVQSLQRQVEHLSMKLASVNPGRPDLNLESILSSKEMLQSRLSSILGGPETNATFGLLHQQQGSMLGGPCGLDFRSTEIGMDSHLRRSMSAPIPCPSGLTTVDNFDDNVSLSIGWDGELQSIVQMGLGHQGRFGSSLLEGLHCQLPLGHMKVEL